MSDESGWHVQAPYVPVQSWPEHVRDSPVYQVQRPATVVTAAVLTAVTAAFTILGTLLMTGVALWLGDPLFDSFSNLGNLRWYVVGLAVVAVSWALGAAWLAWHVTRGRNWARLALVGSTLPMITLSAALITTVVSAISLISGVVVIVLLFTGGANEWFRSQRTRPTGEPVGQNVRHA